MKGAEREVAIIGAGPSGCAAARLLTSWGHDAVLLGRPRASDRAMAESLPPSGVRLLDRVGMAGHATAGFLRSTGNTVRWGDGGERIERFASGTYGYQVDRAEFDEYLVREAAGAGAEVYPAAVSGVTLGAVNVITAERGGRIEVLRAQWVLDCSGRSGLVARSRWRRPEAGTRTLAVAGIWERAGDWPTTDATHTIVESTDTGWAWSVPVSQRRRYVTLMLDPTITTVRSGEGMERAYAEQLAGTHTLAALVKGAMRVGALIARDASTYSAHVYAERGALLVGDAGSFVDPLSSYGIKKALASAWLASVVVHSILLDASAERAALELFNARERAIYGALRHSTAALAADAAHAHSAPFWDARSAPIDLPLAAEPDVTALRMDSDVLRALDQLRSREVLRLRAGAAVHRVSRPTVRGNRVVVENHLVVPAFPNGVRYVRNIDLERLSELALSHGDVPTLFEAYNRVSSPAPLPDFLGALSLLIGKGFLEWERA